MGMAIWRERRADHSVLRMERWAKFGIAVHAVVNTPRMGTVVALHRHPRSWGRVAVLLPRPGMER